MINDVIIAAIIGGAVGIIAAWITARAATSNYMQGASQSDWADAATKYATLNEKLQSKIEALELIEQQHVLALDDARGGIENYKREKTYEAARRTKELEDDDERIKGIIERYTLEVRDLKNQLMDAIKRIEAQAKLIEQMLSKQHQLAENYAGVSKESKKKDGQLSILMAWVQVARNKMVDNGITPPLLDIK